MRKLRITAAAMLAAALIGCEPPVEPEAEQVNTDVEFVVQLGGACFGKVLEPIRVFIDSNYMGQVSPGGRLTSLLARGRHQLNASGGPWRWGPFEIDAAQRGATLDC